VRLIHYILGQNPRARDFDIEIMIVGLLALVLVAVAGCEGGVAMPPAESMDDAQVAVGSRRMPGVPAQGLPVPVQEAGAKTDAAIVSPDVAIVSPDAAIVSPDGPVVSPDGPIVSPDTRPADTVPDVRPADARPIDARPACSTGASRYCERFPERSCKSDDECGVCLGAGASAGLACPTLGGGASACGFCPGGALYCVQGLKCPGGESCQALYCGKSNCLPCS